MSDAESPLGAYHEAVRRHEASLTKGTRVRVRLSECDWLKAEGWTDHTLSVNDSIGRINQIDPQAVHRDEHRFVVTFSEPLPLGLVAYKEKAIHEGYYCAGELVPLDTGAGAEDGE